MQKAGEEGEAYSVSNIMSYRVFTQWKHCLFRLEEKWPLTQTLLNLYLLPPVTLNSNSNSVEQNKETNDLFLAPEYMLLTNQLQQQHCKQKKYLLSFPMMKFKRTAEKMTISYMEILI